MNWSLLVDTDSLYSETRDIYGPSARMDYLRLPLNIVSQLTEIKFFQDKIAMIMRHGQEWPVFMKSLRRFGYSVIPTDRGMQDITIHSKVTELLQSVSGIVVVTTSDRISFLIDDILKLKKQIKVITFCVSKDFVEKHEHKNGVDLILMDEQWLWTKNQNNTEE